MPIIYKDANLNNASQNAGPIERIIFGKTRKELFQNIKDKIWAIPSETTILDDEVSADYNKWIAGLWNKIEPPTEITNIGIRDCRYALPYSKEFKDWLRKNN